MSEKIIFTNGLIDLAQPRLGSKVIYKTDDFFASANRVINPSPAVFKEGLFDRNGKWMDGWESRRKRNLGHDYLIIKLGKPTCGVLVLGIHFSTYTAEVFRAGIDNVQKGQWEAAKSLNYNQYQTWKNVILPQAIPPMIPPLANYLITMFKETPLLAAITVVELFRAADQYSNSHYKYLEPMTLVGVFFLIVSIPSAIIAMKLEKRFKQRKI